MRNRGLVLLIGLLLVTGAIDVVAGVPAQAADGFRLPFVGSYMVTQGRHTSSTGVATAWDIAPINGASSNIYAPGDGTVKIASYCGSSNVSATLQLTSGGQTFVLSHLSRSSVLAAGIGATAVPVSRGQRLGSLWQGGLNEYPCGSSTGTHLHFEVPSLPSTFDGVTFSTSGPGYGAVLTGSGTGSNPQGSLDGASSPTAGTFSVRGWAFDRDAPTSPINIHAYVGGPAGSPNAEGFDLGAANTSRPDVNAVYPGVGNNHGYETTVATGKRGSQPVYVYAINVGGGSNVLLGQGTVNIADPEPFGSFDSLTSSPHMQLRMQGWAIDRNAPTSPVTLHAYVGGPAGAPGAEFHDLGPASVRRSDVAAVYPGTGENHGFDRTVTTRKTGSQPVYVYAINQGPGSNRLILARTVTVAMDTTAPDTRIDRVDSDGRTATVLFSSNEAPVSFECSVGNAPWAPCTSPSVITLAGSPSSLEVRATDVAGNVDASPAAAALPAASVQAPPPVPAPTPAPSGHRIRVDTRVVAHDRIVVDVDPDWKRGNYRLIVQKRRRGAWVTIARTTTRGNRDTVTLDPSRAGTYRVVVRRKGFETHRSGRLRVRR